MPEINRTSIHKQYNKQIILSSHAKIEHKEAAVALPAISMLVLRI
jgi:hypothetical protein